MRRKNKNLNKNPAAVCFKTERRAVAVARISLLRRVEASARASSRAGDCEGGIG